MSRVLLGSVVAALLGGAALLFAKRREAAYFQGLAFGGRIPVGCVLLQVAALLAVAAAWLLLAGQ